MAFRVFKTRQTYAAAWRKRNQRIKERERLDYQFRRSGAVVVRPHTFSNTRRTVIFPRAVAARKVLAKAYADRMKLERSPRFPEWMFSRYPYLPNWTLDRRGSMFARPGFRIERDRTRWFAVKKVLADIWRMTRAQRAAYYEDNDFV